MKPLLKAAVTSCVVMAVGDVACQTILKRGKAEDLDWGQTGRFALIGLTLHGPFFLVGFRLIDRVPLGPIKSALGRSLAKTALTQVTIFPAYLAIMFAYLGALEGLDARGIRRKLEAAWPYTYGVGTVFWPIANVANFLWCPPAFRAQYVACAGVLWNACLSWINVTRGKQ